MKTFSFLFALLLATCVQAKEQTYTGSTPANAVVKEFLGISLADSVDFIRWRLTISAENYSVECNYGISKPNTNGFINGRTATIKNAPLQKEGNYYRLSNGSKKLSVAALNYDLLHILNP